MQKFKQEIEKHRAEMEKLFRIFDESHSKWLLMREMDEIEEKDGG